VTSKAVSTARRAERSDTVKALARAGYVVTGVLYLLLGWIAVRVASGGSGESADQSGALGQLARAPGGPLLLWLAVVAFVALGAWQLLEAFLGARSGQGWGRWWSAGKAAATGAVYLVLGYAAMTFARGAGQSSRARTTDVSAALMGSPAGKVALGLAGAVILCVGGYHCFKGATRRFTQDLQGEGRSDVGRAVLVLGAIGYVAKGFALVIVGVLFVIGVLQSDPAKASGLDVALRTLGSQPYGGPLLVAVGVGLACYGVYSFARARYARL
jgi:hypothetical protein